MCHRQNCLGRKTRCVRVVEEGFWKQRTGKGWGDQKGRSRVGRLSGHCLVRAPFTSARARPACPCFSAPLVRGILRSAGMPLLQMLVGCSPCWHFRFVMVL